MIAHRIGLLCWAAIGLAIAIGGMRHGPGTFETPGPGFMPLLAAVLILVSVGAGLVLSFSGVVHDVLPSLDFVRWKRPLLAMAALVAYAVVFTRLGFVPATCLVMAFLFRVAGVERWLVAVTLGAVAAVGAWLVFGVGLGAQLPKGLLRF